MIKGRIHWGSMKDFLGLQFPEGHREEIEEWVRPPRSSGVDCNNENGAVILIKSRVYGFEKRMIQRTYLQGIGYHVPVVFFVGRAETSDEVNESNLAKEISLYSDVVVGEYEDTYLNLRFKDLYRTSYYLHNCDAPGAIFLDDDVFPNLKQSVLDKIVHSDPSMFCLMHTFKNPTVIRDITNDWYTSRWEYSREFFPDYCSGPCFAFNKIVAAQIINQANNRIFDSTGTKSDVYITGIFRALADVTLDVSLENVCDKRSHTGHFNGKY